MHRIIPEWSYHLMFNICTGHADVLQCFVAQARQQFTFTVKFVPATKLVQQIGYRVD